MNSDSIQIWYGDIAADDAHYQHYWPVLDAAEQAHAGNIKNDLSRKCYVEARGRLRNLLAQILNEAPDKINIKKAEHGKPYLADRPDLAFNLSHSAGAMVVAAAWNCRLGVDMERCRPRTGLTGLAGKCFAEEEIAYWQQLPEEQKTVGFYRFWTRKEAFVKATGRGIALGLTQCVVNPENQDGFLRVPADYGRASTWHALDLVLGQDVCSALVTDKDIVRVSLINWRHELD